jgi:hypothetical protein
MWGIEMLLVLAKVGMLIWDAFANSLKIPYNFLQVQLVNFVGFKKNLFNIN